MAATGIKVDFKIPTGFVNGGTATAASGTNYDAWLHIWNVPTLAAGQTIILAVPCFALVSTPVTAFTQVVACATLDSDSQPDNNTTMIPVEDDEAAITVTTAAALQAAIRQNNPQLIPIVIQKVYPSATEGELMIRFKSIDEREVHFEFYNSFGILLHSELRAVQKGEQTFYFDVWDLPQGTYIIQVSANKVRNVPMKFIKL